MTISKKTRDTLTAAKIARMTFEDYIAEIEAFMMEKRPGGVPGTVLQRSMCTDGTVGWCLGIGMMTDPKMFIYGKTIDEVIYIAYAQLQAWKRRGGLKPGGAHTVIHAPEKPISGRKRSKKPVIGREKASR